MGIDRINWTEMRRYDWYDEDILDMPTVWKILVDNAWHREENNNCPVCRTNPCNYTE